MFYQDRRVQGIPKSLQKWREMAKIAPFDFKKYITDDSIDFFVVEHEEIGRYVGQFKDNKRQGVG